MPDESGSVANKESNKGTLCENEQRSLAEVVAKNSKAIEALQVLPDAFNELKAILLQQIEHPVIYSEQSLETSEEGEEASEYEVDNQSYDLDDEINLLAGGTDQQDDLSSILNLTENAPDFGEDLLPEVATSFGKLIKRKETKEATDKLKETFKVPQNCKTLGVQRVNTEIWSALPNKTKQSDFHLQSIQSHVSLTSVALARLADKILKEGGNLPGTWKKELLHKVLEIATINNNTNQMMIAFRRKDMRKDMSKEALPLCGSQNEATEFLFGDNIPEKIKSAKSALNLVRPKGAFAVRKLDNRFAPYPRSQGNFFRPPRGYPSFRGGPRFRNHTATSSQFSTPGSSRQMNSQGYHLKK